MSECIAQKLKKLINDRGLKQSYIAEKANIDYCRFRRLVNGKGNFKPEELESIARVLKVDYKFLFCK